MKNKKLAGIVLAVLFISMSQGTALANEPDITAEIPAINNSETESTWNPEEGSYVISTVEDLKAFRESLNTGETYYSERQVDGQTIREQTVVTLANDIVIPEGADIGIVKSNVENSTKPDVYFEGYFNGKGHTISGYRDTNTGLVPCLGYNGVITNLNMAVNLNFTEDAFNTVTSGNLDQNSSLVVRYGVISGPTSEGEITHCSVSGDVNIEYDYQYGNYNTNKSFEFYGIRYGSMFTGKPLDWLECSNCKVDLNYKANVTNIGQYGVGTPAISNIADCWSTRASWRGSLINCFSTGTVDVKITTEEGKDYYSPIFSIGRVMSKDFVKNCYYDITPGRLDQPDEDGRPTIQYEEILASIENTEDLTKASTYKGFDFENIWTTNGDTTMPEMRKDIPDEMLLPVIDDGGIKGDVNGDDKVDAKDVSEILQVLKGSRTLSREEKIRGDINNDDIIDKKDVFEIQQAIVGVDRLVNTY